MLNPAPFAPLPIEREKTLMATPAELLEQSLAKFRTANRIDGTRASYRRDNPDEYVSVMAYLDGGPRPGNVTSDMGLGLVLEEDARRALGVVEPPPPPPPPSGNYIDEIAELTSVFLPQNTSPSQIQQGVTNPPGLGGGIWEIADAAGSGFRMVATPQMVSTWESNKKVCFAQMLVRKSVGAYETWKFKYRYPSADNPAWPPLFHAGTIWEFGHHMTNSGVYIGLDSRAGGLGHHLGVPTAAFTGGGFDYFTICPLDQLELDKDYLCEARLRYNPDSTGYCQVKIDGVTIIDQSRPMRPNTSEIPKPQPGWYSNLGTTKNGVELRNIEYAYGV